MLADKIQDAIESGRIQLVYQPIVKLHGEEKPLYQTLLRLSDDKGNVIPALEVFPIARVAGLGVKLDKWIIARVLQTLSAQKNQETQVFVHLSSVSLIEPKMVNFIEKTFAASKVDKKRVIFQFDEADAANHLKRVITLNAELHSKGITTCLSRFGSVPEQTSLLDQLDVDFVRISSDITDKMNNDAEANAQVQHLLDEIHNRDKHSIITKVEEAAMLAALWPMNVHYIQGFYLQRPSKNMDYDFSSNGF